jgi:DNA invertase Pin-like site-specific DNA recombinase
MTSPARAAAYYRFSDDRQENSIARQRSQVEPYAAKNGYQIVKEYSDEGIPGDEEKKRKGFMAMIADAQLGHFQVILCDDKDRYARFDSLTSGYYAKILRDAGVRLETVAQGRILWDSFAARVIDAVLAEAKKLESQATSRRVITRMLQMARQGKWLGGPAPYGYVLVKDPILGKRLVPGDPVKVRTVQLVFRLYGEKGFTLGMVIRELYERGILTPHGSQHWRKSTLYALLENRKYVGDACWNVGHDGKYSEVAEGAIRTSDARLPPRFRNQPEDWIVVADAHEPLVSRDLFEKVQARLRVNQKLTTPLPGGGPFLLTGLLVCGNCGARMVGNTQHGAAYYRCSLYLNSGNRGCGCNQIEERKLLRCILGKLQDTILNPKNLATLRQEVRQKVKAFEQDRPGQAAELSKRLESLDSQIAQAVDRLRLVPEDLFVDYSAMIRGLKEERYRTEEELAKLETARPEMELEPTIKAVEKNLTRLREALVEADPVLVRAFLRQLEHTSS